MQAKGRYWVSFWETVFLNLAGAQESIPPAYAVCWAVTDSPIYTRFLAPIDFSKMPALLSMSEHYRELRHKANVNTTCFGIFNSVQSTYKLFPARESLVSDIPAGDGRKPLTFFYSIHESLSQKLHIFLKLAFCSAENKTKEVTIEEDFTK